MRHDEAGRLVEIGARTRRPPALRRALQRRDRGCRFPGCGLAFGQGHHVRHWARGGPTTLSNLALLCRRHHRAVHEEGYQVDPQPDGALRFRRPDGRPLPEVPPPAARACEIQSRPSGRGTRRRGCASMRGPRVRAGRGAAGSGLGDRRPASAGRARCQIFTARVKTAFAGRRRRQDCVRGSRRTDAGPLSRRLGPRGGRQPWMPNGREPRGRRHHDQLGRRLFSTVRWAREITAGAACRSCPARSLIGSTNRPERCGAHLRRARLRRRRWRGELGPPEARRRPMTVGTSDAA